MVRNTQTSDTSQFDWVIIGGGIHGVPLAARLLGQAGVSQEGIRIIDPGPKLLHSWYRCSQNTGMRFLRSPSVHHLDVDPFSLRLFAEQKCGRDGEVPFTPPYDRPSVQLFSAHCDHVISKFQLQSIHVQDKVVDVDLRCDGVRIELTEQEPIRAKQVILAMGMSAHPKWPSWSSALVMAGIKIHHIFGPDFVLVPEEWPQRIAVIGAGLSGTQAAIRLAESGRTVHLVSRHAIREHQFDSDPGWVGPKYMRKYLANSSLVTRREMIQKARHIGSIPQDTHRALQKRIQNGTILWHQGDVTAKPIDDGAVIQVGESFLPVDGVLLATGFEQGRPGGALLDKLIETHALPCTDCGFPVTDAHLRWHPRVFVSGPLAELEIGPVSRNIVGARRAAERIVPIVPQL